MADAGLFIGWGQVVRGRESSAVDGFNEFVEFVGHLQADGRIEDFEICFLDPHGGDLGGFTLIRGTTEQMDALGNDEEFLRHMTRANLHVDNLGLIRATLGEAIARQMAIYQEEIGALV
jgi:hypothetical protein